MKESLPQMFADNRRSEPNEPETVPNLIYGLLSYLSLFAQIGG